MNNTPFTQISEIEKKVIETYINDWAEVELQASLPYILREWDSQKQSLYELFGNKLILEKPVSFSKSIHEMDHEIDDAYDRLPDAGKLFWRQFENLCNERMHFYYGEQIRLNNDALAKTNMYAKEVNWSLCNRVISCKTLAANRIDFDFTIDLPKPDGSFRQYHVEKGSRPMRVVKRIFDAFRSYFYNNDEGYKALCVWHSQILNDKTVKGDLCLSIHPLDYMTMSDNACDWSSCMSWIDTGCYRGGTVEMMNSPMVIVAYMRSHTDMDLNAGWDSTHNKREYMKWNSKKWRTLIIVNKYGIFSVKAYPYRHDEMTKYAMEWVASLFKDRHFEEVEEFDPCVPQRMTKYDLSVTINPLTNRMYNDFGATKHFAMLDYEECKEYENGKITFTYSGLSECMSCGTLTSKSFEFNGEGVLCCRTCTDEEEEHVQCVNCGEEMIEDDAFYVDDVPLCHDCFESLCFADAVTFEYGFEDQGVDLFFMSNGKPVSIGRVRIDTVGTLIEEKLSDEQESMMANEQKVILLRDQLNSMGISLYNDLV
jgi:hypothetical protein